MPPNTPFNKPTIAHAQWVAEAIQLSSEGLSERAIARRLGLHHSTVQEALDKEFTRARPTPEQVEAARERKRERLYRGLEKWARVRDDSIAACEADPDKVPDHRAGELVLKTEALLANLEGTDAPKRTELTGGDGGPLGIDLAGVSDEKLDAVLASLDSSGPDEGATPRRPEGGEGAEDVERLEP